MVVLPAFVSIFISRVLSFSARFDIRSFVDASSGEDEEGLLESNDKIKSLIAEEIASGTPSNRIVLGGFSQGGAMTLLTGTTIADRLAGLVVMSGWLPIKEKVKSVRTSSILQTVVCLISHISCLSSRWSLNTQRRCQYSGVTEKVTN
jgi:predicted esterase